MNERWKHMRDSGRQMARAARRWLGWDPAACGAGDGPGRMRGCLDPREEDFWAGRTWAMRRSARLAA